MTRFIGYFVYEKVMEDFFSWRTLLILYCKIFPRSFCKAVVSRKIKKAQVLATEKRKKVGKKLITFIFPNGERIIYCVICILLDQARHSPILFYLFFLLG